MKKFLKKNKQLLLYVFLTLAFTGTLLYLRLENVVENAYTEVYNLIPSPNNKGVSMKYLQKNLSLERDSAKIILSLRRGDEYRGTVVVKNLENKQNTYLFNFFDQVKRLSASEDDIDIDFALNELVLAPYEWRIIPYTLRVGADVEDGLYKGIMSVRNKELIKGDDMNIAINVGIELEVEVSDEPKNYVYKDLMANVNPPQLVKGYVVREVQKIAGVIFVILSGYFLYLSFRKKP